MHLKKVMGIWLLMDRDEIIDSFETQAEAELALFDATRKWESLYDRERGRSWQTVLWKL